ncbi:MAG: xanthine/uracil permease [Myxococcota bacterium]
MYGIEDTPPPALTVFLGIQHFLTMVGATVIIPMVLGQAMGFDTDQLAKLIGTIFFVSGITTFLQSTYGNRLPIIQGGTFSLLAPTFAICSMGAIATAGWEVKMQAVQGAIIIGGAAEALIGYSGLVGRLLKYIGPITIAPTIALIGLALFSIGAPWAGKDWWMGGLTILLVVCFSQFFRGVRGIELFPILLAIVIMWTLSAIGRATGHYHLGDPGFLDTSTIANAPMVRVPYPFQWGMPTFGLAAAVGMFAGFVASIVESIGDYYACARLSGAPIPTAKTINKGIGMEGVGSVIAGIFGTGNATTSYSENIGAIGITRVGSRKVIQAAAISLIILGIFGKFSAFFATLPQPVVGGLFCTLFGMIASVGLSNLQFVDLNSGRNLFIIGFALFMGLSLPVYFNENPPPQAEGFWLGVVDVIWALGKSGMSVGAVIAFTLDNTVPGTDAERGLVAWQDAQ